MSAHAAVEKRPTMNDMKTFRGGSLEEVLPQIKAALGPDAEIVRQREGLTGGVGGFFQRACIEVDARPGEPEPEIRARRFDAYDDGPATPEPLPSFEPDALPSFEPDPLPEEHDGPTAEGLTSPGIQEIMRQAAPFADHLDAATRQIPEPEPVPPARSTGTRPQIADAIEDQLVEAGIAVDRAREIVGQTVSHALPFGSTRRLRKLVREGLARRINVAGTPSAGGRSLAFVGPGGSGKTLCTARLAAAYASGSDLPVICISLRPDDGGAELRSMLEPSGVGVTAVSSAEQARAHVAGALGHAIVVVDTPSGVSDADLKVLGLDEVHLTLPSMYSGAAAAEFAERLRGVTHVALTHVDEMTRIGGLVDFLIDEGMELSYISRGPGGLEPANAHDVASVVLP